MLGADGHKVGIIRYREIDNKELIIRGQTLGGILGKRVTLPDLISGYDRIIGKSRNSDEALRRRQLH